MAKFLPAASLTTNFVTRGYYSIFFNQHLFTWIVKFAKVKIQRRHIGHDAKFIRDIHGHQVTRIQQGRNTKLFLCHFECLLTNKREYFTNWYLLQKKKAKGPVLGFLWDPLDVKRQGVLEKSTEYMFRSASTLAHAHRHFPVLLCHSFETEFLHT